MAAVYADIVPLQHIIENIQQHHTPHIRPLGEASLIEALCKRAIFLQDFLESYSSEPRGGHDARPGVEGRIADEVYSVEGILESHIVDGIYNVKEKKWIEFLWENCSSQFDQSFEQVAIDMDVIIEQEVKLIKLQEEDEASKSNFSVLLPSASSTPLLPGVGFDEYLNKMVVKLTSGGLISKSSPFWVWVELVKIKLVVASSIGVQTRTASLV